MPEQEVVKETIIKEIHDTPVDLAPVLDAINGLSDKCSTIDAKIDQLSTEILAIQGALGEKIDAIDLSKTQSSLDALTSQTLAVYNVANNAVTTAEAIPDKNSAELEKAVSALSSLITTTKPKQPSSSNTDDTKAMLNALSIIQDKVAVVITEISKDDKKPVDKEAINTIVANTSVTQATTKELTTQIESINATVNDIKEAL